MRTGPNIAARRVGPPVCRGQVCDRVCVGSQGSCQWVNIQSRVVTLCDTTLLQLTEMEAAAVQQVALQRLADFNLGCTVRIPKGRGRQLPPASAEQNPVRDSMVVNYVL